MRFLSSVKNFKDSGIYFLNVIGIIESIQFVDDVEIMCNVCDEHVFVIEDEYCCIGCNTFSNDFRICCHYVLKISDSTDVIDLHFYNEDAAKILNLSVGKFFELWAKDKINFENLLYQLKNYRCCLEVNDKKDEGLVFQYEVDLNYERLVDCINDVIFFMDDEL